MNTFKVEEFKDNVVISAEKKITSNFTNPKIFSHLGHSIFYASFLRLIYPYWIKSIHINVWSAEIEIKLIGSHIFYNFFLALKNQTSCQFSILIDFFAVDFPNSFDRFKLIGILGSYTYKFRLFVSIPVRDGAIVPSLCSIFSSSQWFEREIWDMFGIFFINNFDLRRILTDYGFSGFPLRKDFPVSGFFELRYNESYKSIISEPVEYTQEYRVFDFSSSWK